MPTHDITLTGTALAYDENYTKLDTPSPHVTFLENTKTLFYNDDLIETSLFFVVKGEKYSTDTVPPKAHIK